MYVRDLRFNDDDGDLNNNSWYGVLTLVQRRAMPPSMVTFLLHKPLGTG